jgi:1,4-dihydroxy-2-naphthoyl-CoA synthase
MKPCGSSVVCVRSTALIGSRATTALGLYYRTPEALEGRNAFVEKRPVDFRKFRG